MNAVNSAPGAPDGGNEVMIERHLHFPRVYLPRTLPSGLDALADLALDLRWTWSHKGDALWQMLDRETWDLIENPWVILQVVPSARLNALAHDPVFLQLLNGLNEERTRYMEARHWFLEAHAAAGVPSIAFFSMEFGLGEGLPLYAGGLGVLAGDYLKTASDLGVPLVGVGLLYQEGYFRQTVDAGGAQLEAYPFNDPMTLPIQPAMTQGGDWLRVGLEFPGRRVVIRVWRAIVGRTSLYLLDTNDPLNAPADRAITGKLYGGGQEMRLMQEIILGIGGWRSLDALGIPPDVCHLNEGHAAFVALERAHRFMQESGLEFREALWATRAANIFTTHTPVAAGFDAFEPDLLRKYFRCFESYVAGLGGAFDTFLALGQKPGDDRAQPFRTAFLAMRGSASANGVSRLHGDVSRHIFSALYPRWPEREVPVGHVTNGVHVPSWDSAWADDLWTSACGPQRWRGMTEELDQAIQALDDQTIWSFCTDQRSGLIRYVRRRLANQLEQRGADPEAIARAREVLDPNVLILGFARRFAEYKRPCILLDDPQRLKRLLNDSERPIQIVVAGKAHPDDEAGKRFVQMWVRFANEADVRHRVVFLEDYDIRLAQILVQGVDVWVSASRRPWEACGTSGMKVLVNGGLNLAALDGWWAEAYTPDVGWSIGDGDSHQGTQADHGDATNLYDLIEHEIAPLFYHRDLVGIPVDWIGRMRQSMSRLAPRFSCNRMVQEYVERYYFPAAEAWKSRRASGGTLARTLHAWHRRLEHCWSRLHFGDVHIAANGDSWGFRVSVYLCDLTPEDVRVELCAEAEGTRLPPVRQAMEVAEAIPGTVGGFTYTCQTPADRSADRFTPRVVPFHAEASVPIESPLILWQR